MWPNPQFPADLVTFTEEILNKKLHFFAECSIEITRRLVSPELPKTVKCCCQTHCTQKAVYAGNVV